MGLANSSSRLGSLLLIPAIAWAIDPDFDRLGWSLTAALLGIASIVLALPLSRLIRNRPEDYGLLPDGNTPGSAGRPGTHQAARASRNSAVHAVQVDFTVKEALRTPAFWLISIGHGFTSMVLIGLMAHLAPMLTDRGYSLQTAAFVVTAYTTVSMFFQILGDYVGDRVPKHLALMVFTFIQAGGVFILIFGPPTLPVAYGFAIVFGIGFGGRNPLTTSIRGDYFGRKSFGKSQRRRLGRDFPVLRRGQRDTHIGRRDVHDYGPHRWQLPNPGPIRPRGPGGRVLQRHDRLGPGLFRTSDRWPDHDRHQLLPGRGRLYLGNGDSR